jgi:hypothetical protein
VRGKLSARRALFNVCGQLGPPHPDPLFPMSIIPWAKRTGPGEGGKGACNGRFPRPAREGQHQSTGLAHRMANALASINEC